MTRNRLYVLLSSACIAGYLWLCFFYFKGEAAKGVPEVCLFKYLTSIPCPSCGSTRSIILLLHGNFEGAFFFNPFGYILVFVLLIAPIWIMVDLITAKATLYVFYRYTENLIKRKLIAIPLIIIVILNWIWNIYKKV